MPEVIHIVNWRRTDSDIPENECAWLSGLGADQREARWGWKVSVVWRLHLPPFPSRWNVFGTARSGQGRAGCGFAKILWSGPLRARTVLEHGAEGKGGQPVEVTAAGGCFHWGSSWPGLRLFFRMDSPFKSMR